MKNLLRRVEAETGHQRFLSIGLACALGRLDGKLRSTTLEAGGGGQKEPN